MKTWIQGANGNRCSVDYFGSREAAQQALDSLTNCLDCINCSNCFGCTECDSCSECTRCVQCVDCILCSGCFARFDSSGKNGDADPDAPPVPTIPDIHKAIYAAASQPESLYMEDVHACDNTHCRGGWAIALAGEAGRELERFFGWELAAMKIYDASAPGYKINPARFYDSNEAALSDMKALAEQWARP